MAAVEIQCIQTWAKKSGVPEDAVQNQWIFHYGSGADLPDAMDDIRDNLLQFWTNIDAGQTNAPEQYMSPALSDGVDGVVLDFYDITAHLDGTSHGTPIGRRTLTLTPGGGTIGTGLPDEVSTVLTFHRPYGTDEEFAVGSRPRARDRGRLYFGPLDRTVLLADSLGEVRIDPVVCQDFVVAAAILAAHVDTTRWAQWSRVTASIGIVASGWMDNAFDTQRRRGVLPNVRMPFSV